MRFHVIGLPHTEITRDFSYCAFTDKVRKFCNMMHSLGHEVFLYSGGRSEASCTEHIEIFGKEKQLEWFGEHDRNSLPTVSWSVRDKHWYEMNSFAIAEIGKRIQEKDFICVISGQCNEPIAEAFPDHMTVEFGIGYAGAFAKYRVYESYAWMHTVLGAENGAYSADGRPFDAVIPNYFEPDDFPLCTEKENYFLFVGRLIDRKGWRIAQSVCEKLGVRFVVAGQGEFDGYGEHVGVINPEQRKRLMGKARGLFAPTQYIGPFEGVHGEAMMCGTPVITSDWGAFTETVRNGFNGFRCRTFQDYIDAVPKVLLFSEDQFEDIHFDAHAQFSVDNVKYEYQEYFKRLLTLWEDGWYNVRKQQ